MIRHAERSAAAAEAVLSAVSRSRPQAALLVAQGWRALLAASGASLPGASFGSLRPDPERPSLRASIEAFPVAFPTAVPAAAFCSDVETMVGGTTALAVDPEALQIPLAVHAAILRSTCRALRGRSAIAALMRLLGVVATAGALGAVVWATTRLPHFDTWRAEYYDNSRLEGTPVYVGSETKLDFHTDGRSPVPAIGGGEFSIRWESQLVLPKESNVRFVVLSDDGARLFIDEQPVLDEWRSQTATSHETTVDLSAGSHRLRIEYFQRGGAAAFTLKLGVNGEEPSVTAPGVLQPLLPARAQATH